MLAVGTENDGPFVKIFVLALLAAIECSSVMSNVPATRYSMTIPINMPTSPALVIQNAFTAARAADGRWYQKPIRRYEQRPTASQKT